ncbi:MAG: hypothetical protein ACJAWW_002152 [Sulfurimonas sp.]|jgi:hypothetical protein
MKKYLSLFYLISLLFNFTLFANDDLNSSVNSYTNIDEQKVFNTVKEMYEKMSPDFIVYTTWDQLHLMKRSTFGFLNIDIKVDNILLSYLPSKDKNTTNIKLEIFQTNQYETKVTDTNPFAYELFWNRLEYALGKTDKLIDCTYEPKANMFVHNPLCKMEKESFLP